MLKNILKTLRNLKKQSDLECNDEVYVSGRLIWHSVYIFLSVISYTYVCTYFTVQRHQFNNQYAILLHSWSLVYLPTWIIGFGHWTLDLGSKM